MHGTKKYFWCICWLACGITWPAFAQLREGFESPNVAWLLSGSDAGVRILSHKREYNVAHSGIGCEHLRFVAGRGTHIYYSFPLERSPIVEETRVGLWVKGDKDHFQIMCRVVLPRTLDERTGQPLTTLLRGDEYLETGAWQEIRITEIPKLLARDLIVLRAQFGPRVDIRDAYIDTLVLNLYGGPGETNIWLDDLELHGLIDPNWKQTAETNEKSANAGDAPITTTERPSAVEGNMFLLQGRPQFVRAIEERGESWELLRALGFNAIWMSSAPTLEQQADAKRLGLWIIAPPPDLQADITSAAKLDQVILWSLGRELQMQDLTGVKFLAAQIRGADRQLRRPMITAPRTDFWGFSRESDLLLLEMPALFSAVDFPTSTHLIRAELQQSRTGTPHWVSLQLSPAPELVEQIQLLDTTSPTLPNPDWQQARLAMFAALRTGPRGMLFRSRGMLSADNESAQKLQSIYRLLNAELQLLEPWLAGSTAPQDIPTGDASLQATLWQTERARLLLLTRNAPQAQYTLPPVAPDSMSLVLPGVPASDRVFHVTSDGLRQLQGPLGSNGIKLEIPEAGHAAAVAITQNSLVIQHLARRSEEQRRSNIETRLRLAANEITHIALTREQIRSTMREPPNTQFMLRESENLLLQADRMLVAGDLTGCYRHVRRVENILTTVKRQWWDTARSLFPNSLASPVCVSFETLPSHVRMGMQLQQARWGQSALPAGDFENLERLLSAGWKQHRRDTAGLINTVELSQNLPHSGQSALRIATQAQSDAAQLASFQSPVAITTAPLAVRAGQLARIRGWVKLPSNQNASLTLSDNLTGKGMEESLPGTGNWQEFLLYRAMPTQGTFQIQLALRGTGEAYIDNVTIDFIDLTTRP